jgi:hypothetical protein
MDRCPCCGQSQDALNGMKSCDCQIETRSDLDGQRMLWCQTHQRVIPQPDMPPIPVDQFEAEFPNDPSAL